ncbi:uncharacterized protein LOC124443228 [Xenia sp. Carnegie-2017]|uniref:uncharacterized protein LOC124443228 n=1 Tax=Xenia sp. Carnegie-2017 TaxID=2897299 RepID=UPI001F044DF6|nr:uncharacterized protein LOC124443228 [Xenia sp. Carnegie-2017]XP_046849718.1 uncharacterized protein LOC124443228 [Xenia sp. Carnegie-2017]
MASHLNLTEEENGTRLSKLLINKGAQALKDTLQSLLKPSNLSATLNDPCKKRILKSIKFKVIGKDQWDLLYPSTASPDIGNFDISLLTVLLRNICGLTAPAGGWDNFPSHSDTSVSANIARIKYYRNKVYGHITKTSVDDIEFKDLWQEISTALVGLGIQQTEVDELKEAPLSLDEANYIEMLKDWHKKDETLIESAGEIKKIAFDTNKKVEKNQEDVKVIKNYVADIKEEVMETKADVAEIKADVAEIRSREKTSSDLEKLGKCDFDGLKEDLSKKLLQGTRQWLFEKLDTWFNDEDVSNVMVLIAGPGVGKSVFSAEVCRRYSEKKELAACHFCKYNRSDYRNPRMLIESLASNMCDTISGFKSQLNEGLKRKHSKIMIADAFRVLLNDPLHSLENDKPMLLVIDALDESQANGKSELLDLIAKEFRRLPKWIKIFITSRPELPVQNELNEMNPVEIKTQPRDKNNEEDLHQYLKYQLNYCRSGNTEYSVSDDVLRLLVEKCEGSFLYAYYAHQELKSVAVELTKEIIKQLVPLGLSGFYKNEFLRVKTLLKEISLSTNNIVFADENFKKFLEVLVACRDFLPQSFVFKCLGLPDDIKFEDSNKIFEMISQILPAYDDRVTVYHKSLIDWLESDGYKKHEFTVDSQSIVNGHQLLWRACEKEFHHIKSINIFEDKMNTATTEYALKNGIYHMIECGKNVDFSWAADVKIVFAILKMKGFEALRNWASLALEKEMIGQWQVIVKERRGFLSKDLLQELSELSRYENTRFIFSIFSPWSCYLQFIANRIDVSDEKKLLAKNLLKQGKFVWFEDLFSTTETNIHYSTVSSNTNTSSIFDTFSLDFWRHLLSRHLWIRPERHPFLLKSCCCFSPDGSLLVAFVRTDYINIVLWHIERYTIVQVISTKMEDTLGCWWSNGLLWMWDGSNYLKKISMSSNCFADAEVKYVYIGFKPKDFLTFGDVLVCIDQENVVRVVRITNGEIQYNKCLPIDSFDCRVAVSPDNSVILSVNKTKFTIWKWRNTDDELYLEAWHTAETPEIPVESYLGISVEDFRYNCSFTNDSKQAVLFLSPNVFHYFFCLIDVHSTGNVSAVLSTEGDYLNDVLFVYKSYCIGIDEFGYLTALDLRSGKKCAEIRIREDRTVPPVIYMHYETGTIAVISDREFNGHKIQFFKVNVPE